MSSIKINSVCGHCGRKYKKRADRVRSPDYCRLQCRKEAASLLAESERGVNCPCCGVRFIARGSQLIGGRTPYCSNSCSSKSVRRTAQWNRRISEGQLGRVNPAGPNHPQWKGGTSIQDGYVKHSAGEHAGRMVHTVLMEQKIGRRITSDEVVHHINHDRKDNRIENLELMTRAEHLRHHMGFGNV